MIPKIQPVAHNGLTYADLGKNPIKFWRTSLPRWYRNANVTLDGNWTILVIRTDSIVFYVVEYTDLE